MAALLLLADRLPADPTPDALFDAFSEWVRDRGLVLYPAQEEALIEVVSGSNVIVATPTGSGKSLVAAGAHFAALAEGRRTFYTAPIKALVSEKFFDLCHTFGRENVGMMTGDAAVNAGAPDHLLHGRDPRQPGPARRRPLGRRAGGDGRVPLLRRPRTRVGLAGAAPDPPRHAADPHVGDPRRRHRPRGRPHPAHRAAHHHRPVRHPAGAARLVVPPDSGARDHRGPASSTTRRPSTSCTSPRRRPSSGPSS